MEPWGPAQIHSLAAVKNVFRGSEAPAQSCLLSRELLRAAGGKILCLKKKRNQEQKNLGFISGFEVKCSYSKM